MTRSTALPLLLLAIPQAVTALEVSSGSPCATHCLNSPTGSEWEAGASNTFTEDVICHDDDYYLTAKGKKFRECVECLQTSATGHDQETDLESFIYNLRYAVSTCVFSKPNPAHLNNYETPCNTDSTCGLLNHALTGDGPSPNVTTAWDYCGADDGKFLGAQLQPCISCLRNSKDQTYLANFMTALKTGCMQGPDIATLEISEHLFTADPVNITDRSVSDESNTSYRHRHLAVAAIVGICLGVVLIFSLAFLLLLIYHIQQNKDCNPEQFYPYGDMAGPHKTPWYHVFSRSRRLGGCRARKAPKEDPPLAETNGDYYNRMEEATQEGRLKYVHDPRLVNRGLDNVMLTHQAYKVNTQISRTDDAETSPSFPPSIAPSRRHQPYVPDPYIEQAYRDSVQEALKISKPESTYSRSPPAASLRSFKPESTHAGSPPLSSFRTSKPESAHARSPPAASLRSFKPESTHARSPPLSSFRASKPESAHARSPPAASLRSFKPESTHARSPPLSSFRASKPGSTHARSPPAASLRSFKPETAYARSSPATLSPSSPPPLSTTRSTSGLECSSPETLSSPKRDSKSRKPRKFIPSLLKLRPGSTAEGSGDHQLRISPPIMQYDARFDESLSPPSPPEDVETRQRLSGDQGAGRKNKRGNLYIEVPIQNTENDLF